MALPRSPFSRLSLLASLAIAACSPAPTGPAIAVTDVWARATAPGQSSAAFYATIANAGAADTLVSVSSPAGMAMLHSNESRDGIARMRMLEAVPVPSGQTVTLAPGGTHVMVTGVAAPLVAGSSVDLTLRFANAGEQKVSVAIVAPGTR